MIWLTLSVEKFSRGQTYSFLTLFQKIGFECVLCFQRQFLTFILLHCSWCLCRVTVVERLLVLYHSADYISFPLELLGPLWNLWKWSSAHVYARGRKQCCILHYCLRSVSIKPTPIFLSVVCSPFPKAIFLTFICFIVLPLRSLSLTRKNRICETTTTK